MCQFKEVYAPEKELAMIQSATAVFMQFFLDFYNHYLDEGNGTNSYFRQRKKLLAWGKNPG